MKVLVVKRDKLGDLLLATPMLAHLRANWPEARIHLLANDYNAWVVDGNPDINWRHIYRRVRHGGGFSFGGVWDALVVGMALRRERYDWVIVANGEESPRAIERGIAVRGKRTVAYCDHPERYAGLSDPIPVQPMLHEMDRMLGMLAPLGIPPPTTPPHPKYVLPEEAAVFARGWLQERGLTERRYAVLGLGARRAKKQPSTQQILRWSAWLREQHGLDTVFMWTPGQSDDPRYPGDDEVAQPVLEAQSPLIHPFRGPIREALGLIWGARTSLFPDSGLMHFAAASPGGVLGFFAETDVSPSPIHWAPRGPRAEWLEAEKSVSELGDEVVYERLGRLLG